MTPLWLWPENQNKSGVALRLPPHSKARSPLLGVELQPGVELQGLAGLDDEAFAGRQPFLHAIHPHLQVIGAEHRIKAKKT